MHTTAKSSHRIKSIKSINRRWWSTSRPHIVQSWAMHTTKRWRIKDAHNGSNQKQPIKSIETKNRRWCNTARSHAVQSQQRTQRYARTIINAQQRPPIHQSKLGTAGGGEYKGAHTTSVTVASTRAPTDWPIRDAHNGPN